ncbi:cytochrome P450 [Fomitopsis serialis]|uniref:cytochrome P450 n=1 Tax=Fomitopsis serialis TaxID=139415 RepID=UPI0020087395|nr:cytochrome P450 [Neoantrodia serialis]KAH9922092.1 cytochrome P450 [Neoantrodia serialis]
MDHLVTVLAFALLCLLYAALRARNRAVLADLPGPRPESFLMGNLAELHKEEAGKADFRYQAEFGGVARIKAPFGVDMLWICDPKALQYIYQTSGYNFPKQPERRVLSGLMGDHGLTWAEGETHKRQRKVMLPAFGSPEAKALLPVFDHYAEQVTLKWREIIEGSPDQTAVLNVIKLIAPATLDAIGEAAFDYKLGCMENSENELAQAYSSLVAGIFSSPSKSKLFWISVAHYIPMRVAEWLYANLPGKGLDKARQNKRAAHTVARQLLDSKSEALLQSKGSRDVMSIIVRANTSENEKTKLADDEMIAQMRTIMLAGQETGSNTLSFALYELARNPHYQERLRVEIRTMEQAIRERNGITFTASDFDGMPFLQAFVREVLRYHPAVPHNYRQAAKDDVIPLSKPIRTLSGKIVDEIPIPKGTRVTLSLAAYNREKDIWGEDAHVFNPERFLNFSGKRGPTVGVFANILTFSGGIHACIGWRLAILELQSFLVQLVSNFEFGLTEELKRLRRENALVMVPTLEGEPEKGVQLPLKISFAAQC